MAIMSSRAGLPDAREVPRRKLTYIAVVGTLAAAGTLLAIPAAEAGITSIVIDCARSQSPTFCGHPSGTFGGTSFGAVGQYEKLRGTASGELDQADSRNAIITDIELAAARRPFPGLFRKNPSLLQDSIKHTHRDTGIC